MAIKIILIIVLIALLIGMGAWAFFAFDNEHSVQGTIATVLAIVTLVVLIIVPGGIHQVKSGEVAVVREFGVVKETKSPGIYYQGWIKHKYEYYDATVREIKIETQTYSKDNQIIGVNADLQYTIDASQADKIATEYGSIEKLESKITSIALDNIKSVFAQNTATDVINNRSSISASISQTVDASINTGYYVNVKTIVLTNIDFTDDFEAAVAAKVAQEQKRQQALIEQEQKLAEAENQKQVAILQAEAEAEAATKRAEAEAEVARIKAQADKDVAQIGADSAEYQGKKEASIAMQRLASINGWTVVTNTEGINTLVKPDGTLVTDAELKVGAENLIKYYYTQQWNGILPETYLSEKDVSTVIIP